MAESRIPSEGRFLAESKSFGFGEKRLRLSKSFALPQCWQTGSRLRSTTPFVIRRRPGIDDCLWSNFGSNDASKVRNELGVVALAD